MRRRRSALTNAFGFSLIEVIVAVGIFATGVAATVGLFGALAKSTGALADAAAAAGLGDLLRLDLQARVKRAGSFAAALTIFKEESAAAGDTDPRADPHLLFASRDNTQIGLYADAVWQGRDDRKFFEITLTSGRPLPTGASAASVTPEEFCLPYIALIRWPAFRSDGSADNPRSGAPVPRSQQEALLLSGAILR